MVRRMEEKNEEIIFSGRQIDTRVYEGPLWPFLKERMESYGSLIALVRCFDQVWKYAIVMYVCRCRDGGKIWEMATDHRCCFNIIDHMGTAKQAVYRSNCACR